MNDATLALLMFVGAAVMGTIIGLFFAMMVIMSDEEHEAKLARIRADGNQHLR